MKVEEFKKLNIDESLVNSNYKYIKETLYAKDLVNPLQFDTNRVDIQYSPGNRYASVLLPFVHEFMDDIEFGYIFIYDCMNTVNVKLYVKYNDNQNPIILPIKYMNVTSSRYRRTTENDYEAFKVMALSVMSDVTDYKDKYEKIYFKYYDGNIYYRDFLKARDLAYNMFSVAGNYDGYKMLLEKLNEVNDFSELYENISEGPVFQCTAKSNHKLSELYIILLDVDLDDIDLMSQINYCCSVGDFMFNKPTEYYVARRNVGV